MTRRHAHPGRHHRRRAGRPAALPPARREGIDSVVLETRSRDYVEARIRAGILEQSTVDLLDRGRAWASGCTARGSSTAASTCSAPGDRHHLDFVDLCGRIGLGLRPDRGDQGPDRGPATRRASSSVTRSPTPRCTTSTPTARCDHLHRRRRRSRSVLEATSSSAATGSFGPSRAAVPPAPRQAWERTYPYAWLGILADVAPSTDELIYAWHPDGFALHSMRSRDGEPALPAGAARRRTSTTGPTTGSGQRWPTGSAHGRTAGSCTTGPITDKSVLPMRSFVQRADAARPAVPRRRRRAHRAADRRQGPQPRRRRRRPARPALAALLSQGRQPTLADAYSDAALRRVWRCTHFSWWMTTMLHAGGDPFDAQLQLSQLRWVTSSTAGRDGAGRELRRPADRLLRTSGDSASSHVTLHSDGRESCRCARLR